MLNDDFLVNSGELAVKSDLHKGAWASIIGWTGERPATFLIGGDNNLMKNLQMVSRVQLESGHWTVKGQLNIFQAVVQQTNCIFCQDARLGPVLARALTSDVRSRISVALRVTITGGQLKDFAYSLYVSCLSVVFYKWWRESVVRTPLACGFWLADFPWRLPDLWLTIDNFVGNSSAMVQPTQPFIHPESVNE